jgi:hypothetical protein
MDLGVTELGQHGISRRRESKLIEFLKSKLDPFDKLRIKSIMSSIRIEHHSYFYLEPHRIQAIV